LFQKGKNRSERDVLPVVKDHETPSAAMDLYRYDAGENGEDLTHPFGRKRPTAKGRVTEADPSRKEMGYFAS
jgi:hypothetical protein